MDLRPTFISKYESQVPDYQSTNGNAKCPPTADWVDVKTYIECTLWPNEYVNSTLQIVLNTDRRKSHKLFLSKSKVSVKLRLAEILLFDGTVLIKLSLYETSKTRI